MIFDAFMTSVGDPGFSVGGERRAIGGGGHQPPMQVLFGRNVCKNERIGSGWGVHVGGAPPLDPPMDFIFIKLLLLIKY